MIRLRVLAAAVALVALTGCRAQVSTEVEVTGPQTATIDVAAVFTGEAAAALVESTEARAGLNDLFESRTGARPDVSVSDERFVARATLPLDRVGDLASVTGVRSLSLHDDGRQVRVVFGPATRLAEVVADQNRGEVDADALTATMLDNTDLVISVHYDGQVWAEVLDPSGKRVADAQVRVEGDTATFTRTVNSELSDGELVVGGDLDGTNWLWLLGASLLFLGSTGLAIRQHRTR